MRLLIAVDMEGVTGVVSWDHVDSKTSEYQRFRRLMTEDVNAAVEGALEAGHEGGGGLEGEHEQAGAG